MKKLLNMTVLACGLVALPVWAAKDNAAPAKGEKAAKGANAANALTPEEQKQLKEARTKAAKDESVVKAKAAMDAANKDLNAALIKQDPSLESIVNKPAPKKGEKRTPVSKEDQEKLKAAKKALGDNPAVAKADAAKKAFNDAQEAAMIKADPSVKPLIEKMKANEAKRKAGGDKAPKGEKKAKGDKGAKKGDKPAKQDDEG